jgi:phosphoribosyl 1,2-cyclic phosphodiesterase
MRITVLSSGSGGNCTLVEGAGVRVLLDAGLPLRVARRRAAEVGTPLDGAAGPSELLLTHEHSDHGGCAGVLSRALGLPVRATEGTLRALRDPPAPELWRPARVGAPLLLGPGGGAGQGGGAPVVQLRAADRPAELWATPVGLPHDAADPVAWTFEERTARGSVRAAVVTDLGHAPASLAQALGRLDLLVLEFNHDLRMLLEGPYPWPLKQRIRGDRGHLSNDQAAALLVQLCHPGLKQVVLAHLSEHNNSPALALAAAEEALVRAGSGAQLRVGSVKRPLPPIFCEPGPALAARWRPAQLALL